VAIEIDAIVSLFGTRVEMTIAAIAALRLPYPSRSEISRRVAESFAGPGLTPRWRRRIIEFLRKFG